MGLIDNILQSPISTFYNQIATAWNGVSNLPFTTKSVGFGIQSPFSVITSVFDLSACVSTSVINKQYFIIIVRGLYRPPCIKIIKTLNQFYFLKLCDHDDGYVTRYNNFNIYFLTYSGKKHKKLTSPLA